MSWMDDADIAPCGRCGTDVVLDHDPPCRHGYVSCPGCGPEGVCIDCRRASELDMFASSTYSEAGDPLLDHTAATAARDAAYWAETQRGWRDLGHGPRPDGDAA